jgi:hypothetical protein
MLKPSARLPPAASMLGAGPRGKTARKYRFLSERESNKDEQNAMTDPRQYTFTPTMGPPHHYELDAAGLTYRPPAGEAVPLRWEDIRFLEEGPGQKVDIVATDRQTVVPLFLATQDIGDLLDRVCTELAQLHRGRMETLTFRATRNYFTHFTVVAGVLIALFMAGVLFLESFEPAMLLIVAMTVPIMISLLLQPIEVTPDSDGLHVRSFIRRRLIPYDAIETLAFSVRGDLHVSFLRVMVGLRGGGRIKITRFENLILLYIVIMAYWRGRDARPTTG